MCSVCDDAQTSRGSRQWVSFEDGREHFAQHPRREISYGLGECYGLEQNIICFSDHIHTDIKTRSHRHVAVFLAVEVRLFQILLKK